MISPLPHLDPAASLDERATARLAFTLDVLTPEEMEHAWSCWTLINGNTSSAHAFHQWAVDEVSSTPHMSGHECTTTYAYLGCGTSPSHHTPERSCSCVGGDVYRTVCAPCGWASDVLAREDEAIWAWHDHAWPGWRELPVVEHVLTARNWVRRVEDAYPVGWGILGAPMITDRTGRADRSLPGRSPWFGWDLAAPPRVKTAEQR